MFLPDDTPIIFKLPRDKEYADIYFVHDLHYGSFLSFGGYGAKSAYRPQSDKLYVLRISGKKKSMQTIGFYV